MTEAEGGQDQLLVDFNLLAILTGLQCRELSQQSLVKFIILFLRGQEVSHQESPFGPSQ